MSWTRAPKLVTPRNIHKSIRPNSQLRREGTKIYAAISTQFLILRVLLRYTMKDRSNILCKCMNHFSCVHLLKVATYYYNSLGIQRIVSAPHAFLCRSLTAIRSVARPDFFVAWWNLTIKFVVCLNSRGLQSASRKYFRLHSVTHISLWRHKRTWLCFLLEDITMRILIALSSSLLRTGLNYFIRHHSRLHSDVQLIFTFSRHEVCREIITTSLK